MMNCISADKLTLYVDGLLEPQELNEVMQHLKDCKECRMVMTMFEEENKALKETLSSPKLPDSFADDVLDQLEPIKSKRKAYWIRGMEVAAAAVLCIGLASAVSPGFNGFVSGLFDSESETERESEFQSDTVLGEDVLAKLDRGIVFPLDSVVEGNSHKILIEDLVVDVNQVGFTFKVMNERGKVLEPDVSFSSLYFQKSDGSLLTSSGYGIEMLSNGYGYFEASLSQITPENHLTLKLEIERIVEKNDQIAVELPIDFTKAKEQAKVLAIEDGQLVIEGHAVHFEQLLVTPTQTAFTYTIGKTTEYEEAQQKKLAELQEIYGQISIGEQANLSFKIVNSEGQQLARWAPYTGESEKFLDISTFYPGGNRLMGYNVKFEPLEEEQLFIHVDSILYSQIEAGQITFNTERLTLTKPRLELEGATFTVKNMNMQGEHLVVSMDVAANSQYYHIDEWILLDGKGDRYHSHGSSSSVDDNGIGYFNVDFNKPSVVGPYTLIAVAGSKHIQFEEPIVIEVK